MCSRLESSIIGLIIGTFCVNGLQLSISVEDRLQSANFLIAWVDEPGFATLETNAKDGANFREQISAQST